MPQFWLSPLNIIASSCLFYNALPLKAARTLSCTQNFIGYYAIYANLNKTKRSQCQVLSALNMD